MPKCVLVYGCNWTKDDAPDGEAERKTVNVRLAERSYPQIASCDLAAVRIAPILSGPPRNVGHAGSPALRVTHQIYSFVADGRIRTRTTELVASTIEDDTEIVIAHSLGSVAAYEALCLLPQHNVSLLLTLGSPLAIPHYVMGRLTAFSAYGRFAWPRTVRRWLNFYDNRDLVALRRLRKHFGDGCQIEERPIRISSNSPHRLEGYLACHDVISSLGEALAAPGRFPAFSERRLLQ